MADASEQTGQVNPANRMIRVCVLGPLKIEWEGQATPFPQERLHGRGVAPALGVLKALLTQPNRFATRDWIMEQFWPESTRNRAEERLDDVASSLRVLLRPPGSQEKLLHYVYGSNGRGSGYRLEGYPLLWVDADAFAWSVEQAARFERFGEDALPLWEHAYQLAARGTFLPEEIYSDWATERRDLLAGQYRQCVHRLATLLRERGATEQAILRLRSYWQVHPTDEDILRPLMELLGEREHYQEVEDCYQQCILALGEEEQGRQPDPRTYDIHEFLRTKHLQRKPATTQILVDQSSRVASKSLIHNQESNYALFLRDGQGRKIDVPSSLERLRSSHSLESGIALLKETRRHLLQHILDLAGSFIATPQALIGITSFQQLMDGLDTFLRVDDSTLTQLETITRSHWYLFLYASSKSDLLSSFWGHLQTIFLLLKTSQPGAIRNRLYSIAGESAQMIGEILFDMQDYQTAQIYYEFSISAAKEAGNTALRVVSIGRLSFLPIYQNKPMQAYPLLKEAKQLLSSLSRPMISSWLAVVEAEVAAHLHDEDTCERALEYALTHYQHEGLEEDRFWTRLNAATIPGYRGACYLQLQKPQKALVALTETLASIPNYSTRHRSLILTDMADAMRQQEEIEEACSLLHNALEITTQTKSLMVLRRMQSVRENLEPWKQTLPVKQLDISIREILFSILE